MARVRVGAEDVVDMFRPGGSVELVRHYQNEPDAISRVSRGVEFAKQLYPIAGGIGKLIATGVNALGSQPEPTGGPMFQSIIPGADTDTLRQQAAMRLLQQQGGQPAAQAAGAPQAAMPESQAAPLAQMMASPQNPYALGTTPNMQYLPEGAEPFSASLEQQVAANERAGTMPARPPIYGAPEAQQPEVGAQPQLNPDAMHFDDQDLRRYMDLKKELPGAQNPGVAQRILGEMQALQQMMIQKSMPQQAQRPAQVRYTGPLTQDAMMRAMASARTPDEQRAVLARAGDVPVYSGDLLDLLTGSTGARTQFARELGGMARTLHGDKTPEELDKLRAEAEKERAMAGYYGERPDLMREDIKAKGERATEAVNTRVKLATDRLDADKAKRQELASQKASALSEKVREFDQKEKRLNEELQAKKRGIGAWKKIPGTVINVGRDTVAAGKAMVDAADDVIKEHGTRIRDLDKELSKLPVGNEAELTPPVNPLDSVPAKQKAIMDPDVAKAIQQSHDKQMEAYRDAKAKLALRQRLESDREELAKEARDPESEVGKALRYREKGMQAIQRGTPQPKGK